MLKTFYPYAEDAGAVLKKFGADVDFGLSDTEAKNRQKEHGLNDIGEESRENFFISVLKQFKNPLAVLLAASGALTLFLKEYHNAIIIFAALAINFTIGFVMERKVKDAFLKLKLGLKDYACALRNGNRQIIDAKFLTLGDIICLKEGDRVPADARIVEAKSLAVNESVLTGEWFPAEKNKEKVGLKSHLINQTNMVFTGTLIQSGRGTAVVTRIGKETEFGKIAGALQSREKMSPLQKDILKISRFVGIGVFFIVFVLFLIGFARGINAAEMFLSAAAVAVAAVPEGLPAAITVILVLGMRNLIQRGGLPKNLEALENLGRVDTILIDKTGTLTLADIKVSRIVSYLDIFSAFNSKKSVSPAKLKNEEEKKEALRLKVLEMAQFASDAFIENPNDELENKIARGNNIEKALLQAGINAGINKEELLSEFQRIDFLPFDSERRFSASLHKAEGSILKIFLNGAPEIVVKDSAMYFSEGRTKKFLAPVKTKILNYYGEEAMKGERMIAVASAEINSEISEFPKKKEDFLKLVSGKLTFYGLIGFNDPVREDAREALEFAKLAGIEVKILTGDSSATAKAVAAKVGFPENSAAVDFSSLPYGQIENMDKNIFQELVSKANILSRVLPREKLMIVESLQAGDKVVMVAGDGINDAPALTRADVGLTLQSGTDIAKGAADIILVNNSLNVIIYAIKQGRIAAENIKKAVLYLFSTGFSEIILIGGSLALGFPLPALPGQILWANIIQEGFMNFAYAFEKGEGDILEKETRGAKIFTRETKILIFGIGIITDIFLLILFFVLLKMNYSLDKIRTMMFLGLVSDAIFFALSFKSLKNPLWKTNIFDNIYLIISWALSIAALVCVFSFPFLRGLLEITPLSLKEFLIIFSLGIINLILIEAVKLWLNKKV